MREFKYFNRLKRGLLAGAATAASCCLLQCNNSTGSNPTTQTKALFNPVFSATAAQVRSFLNQAQGGPGAKLVYIDRMSSPERLCYIDFSETDSIPKIHVIAAAKNPEVPVISPDGNWVVYAAGSGNTGGSDGNGTEAGSALSERSSVYLVKMDETAQPILIAADSACEPRFVKNSPADTLGIEYPTLCPDFAWEGYGQTRKVEVDVSGATPVVGSPQVLFPDGSYTGGLSWDNRFLCGGGGDVAMIDLNSGKTRPDTLSYDLIQACNASITSSRVFTNTMMYLNIGDSSAPNLNGGKSWGEWQAILISNSLKQLVKGFMIPSAYQYPLETNPPSLSGERWHHPEWSSHPYFGVATLNVDRYFKTSGSTYDNTEYQERVYLLNIRDSTYLEVLRPDSITFSGINNDASGFYWPWLWVQVPDGFQESKVWMNSPLPQ